MGGTEGSSDDVESQILPALRLTQKRKKRVAEPLLTFADRKSEAFDALAQLLSGLSDVDAEDRRDLEVVARDVDVVVSDGRLDVDCEDDGAVHAVRLTRAVLYDERFSTPPPSATVRGVSPLCSESLRHSSC